jgi:hypothetical protein
LRAVAAVAVLSLAASGCWLQQGFDAGRTRYVAGTAPITTDNADELVELWRATTLGAGGNEAVVNGGDVYVTSSATVARISASTGAIAYKRTLADPGGSAVLRLSSPILHDGELDAGWSVFRPTPGGFITAGGLARLVPATGELIEPLTDDQFNMETVGLAVERGEIVRQKAVRASSFLGTGGFGFVDWRGMLGITAPGSSTNPPFAPTQIAVAGDHLAWGNVGTALGWNGTACSNPDPGSPLSACLPDWQTPLGTSVTGPAALGTDAAVYGVGTNQIAVLDAATGAVRFTGTIPGAPASAVTAPAVAGDTILVGVSDGRIAAFPAAGCGQADCAPLWQTTVGTTMSAAPTVVGDVVVATTSNALVTLRLAGCGAATCPSIASYNVGDTVASVAYDNGRVFVGTTGGQLVAFGLPPT